ncbi:NACHT, LRR and PYD domains-containing protein 3-like [Scyliorhinus torazame]|uniref:NACHT, LRR and PYD domains-containing protein 3-like n=1 Tax=Scyliorhinus torazame TaxID=75743 RepID=UPI003B5A75D6
MEDRKLFTRGNDVSAIPPYAVPNMETWIYTVGTASSLGEKAPFDQVCEWKIIILEELGDSFHSVMRTQVKEQSAQNARQAAEMADDFELVHETKFGFYINFNLLKDRNLTNEKFMVVIAKELCLIQDVLYDIQKIYYPFLVAVGVPINLLTIVILSKGKCGLSKGTTCYLVAMAAADMLVAILDSMLRQIPISYSRLFSFLWYVPVCNIHAVLLYATTDCSVWFTVTFTFDRFVAICWQNVKVKYCTQKTAVTVIGTVSFLSCLKNIFWYFLLRGRYKFLNAPWFCYETFDVQQKHKETLRKQTERLTVNTILIKEKVNIFQLIDRYAELTIISTVRDRTLVEHELLARGRDHEEWRKKHLRRELEKIRTDQLFQSSFFQKKSKSGSSAAVSGVPGIGKTTMVQKIVYDWATGKIYPHFQFVFSFKFRDLNSINCRINLRNLILDQYPYFGNVLGELWKNPEGLLFIFDSLDEFNDRIDFADTRRNIEPQSMCTDPECWCEVSDIVYSLIQHKLLPGCSVLVTSRPTELHLLEKAGISVWAEILGFVGDERKEYFNKFFEDQTVAAAVFKHVEENEILYTMCYNPSYCWILGLSLGPFFTQRDRKQQQVPKTITQLYSYYIYNILKNHGREIESPRDVLLKLGEMAFAGVSEKKIVFRNGDLIEYNLQPSQFLSGFLMELLERDDTVQSVVYTFPHLTIQEFAAALAQFLTPDPGNIRKLLSEVHSEEDGRFEIFLRFVAGLSSPQAAWPLVKFLGPFLHQTTCRVIDWVKEKVEGQIGNIESESGKRNLLNTFHYLFESQNKALARSTVGSMKTLTFSELRLTPIDCVVLSQIIGLCDTIQHLDLERCLIQSEGLQRVGPVLHKCQALRLGYNNLGDPGVKLLSVALTNPDCKIQKMELYDNALTHSCTKDLACALSINQSLTDLNLGNNKLGDSGVKQLCLALGNPNCKIQKLGLGAVALTTSCAESLVDALRTNHSLTDLDLSVSNLGDSGVKLLSAALRNPDCKIQTLNLWSAGLTDSCVEDLDSAVSENRSLKDLNLGSNSFTDQCAPALQHLTLTCRSLQRMLLLENLFSPTTKRHLRALRESRSRLSVIV